MQIVDQWGLETTAPDRAAVERLDAAVDAFVTFDSEAPTRLAESLAGDAAPLAHILFGYLVIQAHTAADHARATQAAALASNLELNERERQHLVALQTWLIGDLDGANDCWGRLLDRWPTDMLALRLQHFRLFSRGRLVDMERSVRRSIVAWDDRPRRSYLDGMLAFSLEEQGEYRAAEQLGRDAVGVDESDLWSVHAVAHVLEMERRASEGLAWFAGRDGVLTASGSFARHLWWHHAIIHLSTGDTDQILAIYDSFVDPVDATDGLSLTNAIDVLARLEFYGADVGDRWAPLVAGASYRIGFHDQPFNDAHYCFALARAGAVDLANTIVDGMASWRDQPGTAGEVIGRVGLDTARAMSALGAGRSDVAAPLLAATASNRWELGGSHAQRQLFDLAQRAAQSV